MKIKLTENKLRQMISESVKNILNEEFGVDFNDTLRWVQRKNPNMHYEDAEKFAINIIKKRENQRLSAETSNTPNTDNIPLKKRFLFNYFTVAPGSCGIDIKDVQTDKIHGHAFKTPTQALKWRKNTLEYIVKNIPTNTNFFIENIDEKPGDFKNMSMFDRVFVEEEDGNVIGESYGYDAYPQSGYEEFHHMGEQYAYKLMKDLHSQFTHEDIDERCIREIIDGFKDSLWALAEVGDEYEGINKFNIK